MVFDPARSNLSQPLRLHYAIAASTSEVESHLRRVSSIPVNGHRRTGRTGPFRAMCGRLRVGKDFLHVAGLVGAPCVRPLAAVHMTAGHNALRGSGPGQQHAFDDAMARVGCPDRRIDRLCITCCSPSQPSHHAGCPARSRLRRQRDGLLVTLVLGHHGPGHPRNLVGKRDGGDLGRAATQ
jgi:hypothetical protein